MNLHLQHLTQTIARAAPLLGTAFAGSGGAAIGEIIATQFGGDLQAPQDLHALIKADPDATIKLKQIELDHRLELERLTLTAATESLRESAARSQAATQSNQPDHTPATLAYLLTLGLLVVILALLFVPLSNENAHLIWGLVSSLATVWVGAMGYHHGSSLGASESTWVRHLHYNSDPLKNDASALHLPES